MIRWLRTLWAKPAVKAPTPPLRINYRLDVGDDVMWRTDGHYDNIGRIIGFEGDQAHIFSMQGPERGPHIVARKDLRPVFIS